MLRNNRSHAAIVKSTHLIWLPFKAKNSKQILIGVYFMMMLLEIFTYSIIINKISDSIYKTIDMSYREFTLIALIIFNHHSTTIFCLVLFNMLLTSITLQVI